VAKKVARNADLIRRENSPSRCRGIANVVKRDAETEASPQTPAENLADGAITDTIAFRTHPERGTIWMPEQQPVAV
jgi:hypothetical protein